MRPAGALTVRVADEVGKPCAGAVVTVTPEGTTSTVQSRWKAFFESGGITGADGGVRIVGLAAGRYVAHLDQSEFGELRSEPVEVAEGEDARTRITTGAPARVRVLLRFGSAEGSVAGIHVYARLLDATGAKVPTHIAHGTSMPCSRSSESASTGCSSTARTGTPSTDSSR